MNKDYVIVNGELYSYDDLQHHGIKGMKWGVRRYQNPDGSLTAAGRRRYDVGEARQTMKDAKSNMKTAKKEWDKAYSKAYNYSRNHYISQFTNAKRKKESDKLWNDATKKVKKYNKAKDEYKVAKKEYKDIPRVDKLEAEYRSKGMSELNAKRTAAGRVEVEKALLVAGAVTLTVAASIVLKKNMARYADDVIKAGTKLQRVTITPNEPLNRRFYASYKKLDNLKYRGLYGGFEKGGAVGNKVFKSTLSVDKNLKVASRKKAEDVFVDLWKNDAAFKKDIIDSRLGFEPLKFLDAQGKLKNDRQLRKKGYDFFNRSLSLNEETSAATVAHNKFYERLKSMGYDAIGDVNDMKYTMYKTKSPVIVFNAPGKVSLSKAEEMAYNVMKREQNIGFGMVFGRGAVKTGATITGAKLGSDFGKTKISDLAVLRYRELHPNTMLTDTEIRKMLEKSKK